MTDDSIERSSEESESSPASRGLGTEIHELFKTLGGVELEIPPRTWELRIPDFSGPEFAPVDDDADISE